MTEADERERLIAEICRLAPSFGRLDRTDLIALRQILDSMHEQMRRNAAAGFVDDHDMPS
jgi:hypothetical protein